MKNVNPMDSTKEVNNNSHDKLRMHGWTMGLVLFVSSIVVATSVTAVINGILIAIPVITVGVILASLVMGVPILLATIQVTKEANEEAAVVAARADRHEDAVLLSLEGFWTHAHSWQHGHAHFVSFQPIDHDIVIHLDSASDANSMTMKEFMQMGSGENNKAKEVERSLEGLTDYRRY